jgi:hypothetical protein
MPTKPLELYEYGNIYQDLEENVFKGYCNQLSRGDCHCADYP